MRPDVAMLDALLRAPGRVLSRAALCSRAHCREAAVPAGIARARRSLRADPSLRLETVRGAGYRLVPSGPMVHRGEELERLATLLRVHRGVAVVGPAGAGKTRLVREWSATAEVPCVHVDLAGCRGGLSAVAAIAGALDVEPDARALVERLREAPTVLILDALDGFEPLLHELVERAPTLRVVATSRGVPEVTGVLELQPLSVEGALALYDQVAASPWSLDELRLALERLERWPGSVELLAGSADTLGSRDLARGRLVTVDDVVAGCWRRLPPAERDALVATSACAGVLPRAAFGDVAGSDEVLGALLARRMLRAEVGGLRAPSALRAHVAARVGDVAREAWSAWVARNAAGLDARRHLVDLLASARQPDVLEVLLRLQWLPLGLLEGPLDDLPPTARSWRLRAVALRREGRELEADAALELARRSVEVP